MQEQERNTVNISHLIARGGLTPAHWEEVLDRIGKVNRRSIYLWLENPYRSVHTIADKSPYGREISRKIVHYALGVLNGTFPDAGFHHRRYLGQRHWGMIYDLSSIDRIETPSKIPFLPKVTYITNRTM